MSQNRWKWHLFWISLSELGETLVVYHLGKLFYVGAHLFYELICNWSKSYKLMNLIFCLNLRWCSIAWRRKRAGSIFFPFWRYWCRWWIKRAVRITEDSSVTFHFESAIRKNHINKLFLETLLTFSTFSTENYLVAVEIIWKTENKKRLSVFIEHFKNTNKLTILNAIFCLFWMLKLMEK